MWARIYDSSNNLDPTSRQSPQRGPHTVYLEITAPIEVLGFSRPAGPGDTVITIEPTVSIPGQFVMSVALSGTDVDPILQAIRDSGFVKSVTYVTDSDAGEVYQLKWGNPIPEFLQRVRDCDGELLTAVALDDRWKFRLRFGSQETTSHFYRLVDDLDDAITVQRLRSYESTRSDRPSGLTSAQRETLILALENGYFEVPRQHSLNQLADELGISDSAVSQRLRRGLSSLLTESSVVANTRSQAPVLED